MELIIGLIVALFGGLIFYKKKADKAAVDTKLAKTRGQDIALKEQQDEVKAAIETLDKGIEAMKKEKEAKDLKRKNKYMSLKERKERIKKGLK